MSARGVVLDANILMRAVLGTRARHLIGTYAEKISFFVPDAAYRDAEEHLVTLTERRHGDPETALVLLRSLRRLMELVSVEIYGPFEAEAQRRLAARDPEDWPILATALALGYPIWTEDTDFFGCGVPTWTSDRVEIYLQEC